MQICVMASMLVCFGALYGTMTLSMQYYLVTRAMGHVSVDSSVAEEASVLAEVNLFMKRTRQLRHIAVKAIVISVSPISKRYITFSRLTKEDRKNDGHLLT